MLLFRLYIAYYLRSGKEAVLSVSSIYPRKTMTNRTRLQSMAKPHKYDQKAEKTKDGELVSSYMWDGASRRSGTSSCTASSSLSNPAR